MQHMAVLELLELFVLPTVLGKLLRACISICIH